MTLGVRSMFKARHQDQGSPADGRCFPATTGDGHITGDGVKDQHTRALLESKVDHFVPYVLRHTALTRLAQATNGDVFALARIAGHASITTTQRYVHPQAETIEGIFNRAIRSQMKTKRQGAKRVGMGTIWGTVRMLTQGALTLETNK